MKTHQTKPLFPILRRTGALLVVAALIPMAAWAGNGTFSNGVFNFCISVRFNASDAQLQQIRTAFQNGSQILADATDGQHRFGKVTLVNNSGASESAEYWVNSGAGTAYATFGQYGVRGQHVMLYFDSNFQGSSGADGDAYTVAHEHAHHAYGLADEYSGPAIAGCPTVPGRTTCIAECAAPPPPADAASLEFCLMDNYFTRGGRAAGATYTLNEFCIAANHDLANTNGLGRTNTFQQSRNGRSCWQTIAAHASRSATAPAGLPVAASPAAHTVTFVSGSGGLRVMIVIDRSGSMSGERITFAKAGANVFLNFLKAGDEAGLVSFSSGVRTDVALSTVAAGGGGTVAAIRAAVGGLSASGSTDIGDALIAARDQLVCATNCSCNQIIVLLTDGDHNVGTPPQSVVPSLRASGITVLSVAVGTGISTSGQATLQSIANQTGGRYFSVASASDLIGLFLRLSAETSGSGVLTSAPFELPAGGTSNLTFKVESSATSATFALALGGDAANITLNLVDPVGTAFSETNLPPGFTLIVDNNLKAIRVENPTAGDWTMQVSAGGFPSGRIEPLVLVENPGVGLNLFVEDAEVVPAEPMIVRGTPIFSGEAVVGAVVAGNVTRPDNSIVPIILFDDGLPEHADIQADDGVYSARFATYNQQGTYTFDLEVINETGRVFEGESLFAYAGHPPNNRLVPPFRRSSSVTAVLTATPVSTGPTLTVTGALALNRQTGLYEQVVTARNDGGAALDAFRINIAGLPAGISVYNASGTNAGVPYVLYNQELDAGQSATLTIEYYSEDRVTVPTPTLTSESGAQEPPPSESGTPLSIRRLEYRPDGSALVEFDTVPGRHYRIEYSVDALNWKKAIPSLQASGIRTQWMDAGPPKTDSAPGTTRFYRVLALD